MHLLNKAQYTVLRAIRAATTAGKVQRARVSFCQYRAAPCTLPEVLERRNPIYNGASDIILCFPTGKVLRAFEASASAKASQKNRALSCSISVTAASNTFLTLRSKFRFFRFSDNYQIFRTMLDFFA